MTLRAFKPNSDGVYTRLHVTTRVGDETAKDGQATAQDWERLTAGAVEIVDAKHLQDRLARGDRLRVKLGLDPTRPDIHLGHTVVLRALRRFQERGHKAILIIGDTTAQIGDPSGQSATRPQLSRKEVESAAGTYLQQAWKILDEAETEVRWQSEWFDKMNLADLVRLMSYYTVAKMLAREDFAKRHREARPIGLHELLYPLLQAYDSVAVKADLELGGTDQTFNLLVGRDIQQAFGQPAQDIMTTPLLEGIDGIQKMSKSLDNYVAIDEEPQEIYRKILSIPDSLIPRYFRLATLMSPGELREIEVRLKLGENPLELKKQLAKLIIAELRSPLEAEHVYEDIRTHVSYKNRPIKPDPRPLSQLFIDAGLANSKSEVRRLVSQNGIFINEQLVVHPDGVVTPETGMLLRRGRHHAVRLVVQ